MRNKTTAAIAVRNRTINFGLWKLRRRHPAMGRLFERVRDSEQSRLAARCPNEVHAEWRWFRIEAFRKGCGGVRSAASVRHKTERDGNNRIIRTRCESRRRSARREDRIEVILFQYRFKTGRAAQPQIL